MKKRKKTQLDFEIEFYKKIVSERPRFLQALSALGDALTKKGLYEEGLKIDEKLSKINPENSIVFYNLACSYSLVGKIKEAFKALKKAIILGYDDFDYMEKDPDLENLRKSPYYSQLKEKIKRIKNL